MKGAVWYMHGHIIVLACVQMYAVYSINKVIIVGICTRHLACRMFLAMHETMVSGTVLHIQKLYST